MQDDTEQNDAADTTPEEENTEPVSADGAVPPPAETDSAESPDESEPKPESESESEAEAETEPESESAGDEEDSGLSVLSVVEAVLFAAREPLKLAQIARAVGKRVRQDAVKSAVDELNVQYLETGRAFEIAEISGKYQLMSRPEYVNHIIRIYPKRELSDKERSGKLTPAALDTLSIIAYKQPVTRGEIEHIRGVGCGPVLRALIERGSVKVAGKRTDLVGQPLMYGTTEAFLAEFGLGTLDELPLKNEFLAMAEEFMPSPGPEAEASADTADETAEAGATPSPDSENPPDDGDVPPED